MANQIIFYLVCYQPCGIKKNVRFFEIIYHGGNGRDDEMKIVLKLFFVSLSINLP